MCTLRMLTAKLWTQVEELSLQYGWPQPGVVGWEAVEAVSSQEGFPDV